MESFQKAWDEQRKRLNEQSPDRLDAIREQFTELKNLFSEIEPFQGGQVMSAIQNVRSTILEHKRCVIDANE